MVESLENCKIHEAERKFNDGVRLLRESEYDQAIDLLGSALELRISLFGELSPKCTSFYFKYGTALFYKAQSEVDAFGGVSIAASGPGDQEETEGKDEDEADRMEGEDGEEEEDNAVKPDVCETAEEEEDEGDLELAWKLLETAKLIAEREDYDSIEHADIISTLADISLEKEDFPTALEDYRQSLSILEKICEPHDRMIAEISFKLSLAHQLAEQPKEAIHFCRQAIAVCEAKQDLLKHTLHGTETAPSGRDKGKAVLGEVRRTVAPLTDDSAKDKQDNGGAVEAVMENGKRREEEEELVCIEELLVELKEKEEELLQQAELPSLAESLKAQNPEAVNAIRAMFGVVTGNGSSATEGSTPGVSSSKEPARSGFDAPQLAAGTSDSATLVMDLGVIGRGVKRAAVAPSDGDANGSKRRSLEDMMGGEDGKEGETSFGF